VPTCTEYPRSLCSCLQVLLRLVGLGWDTARVIDKQTVMSRCCNDHCQIDCAAPPTTMRQLTAFDRQVSCVARSRNVRDPRLWVVLHCSTFEPSAGLVLRRFPSLYSPSVACLRATLRMTTSRHIGTRLALLVQDNWTDKAKPGSKTSVTQDAQKQTCTVLVSCRRNFGVAPSALPVAAMAWETRPRRGPSAPPQFLDVCHPPTAV
jgi:hypothetical protein